MALVILQIYLRRTRRRAGRRLAYNTWPLMDGHLIPGGLFAQQPHGSTSSRIRRRSSFMHRLGAYVLFSFAIFHMVVGAQVRAELARRTARGRSSCFGLVMIQAMIGIMA